ncbi:MAG: hypothetical protein ROO76_01935 [Terriglobia bacterium]|nr:hypothetical protein [Terriglobia bacterium]
MKTLLRTFAVVAGLALAVPMLAQRGVSPSITNGTHLGYPAASILTPNNMRYGDSAPRGTQRFGSFAAPRMYNPQREHREHREHHFQNGFYSYPYYPAYYYDPFSYGYDDTYVQGSSSLPGAGTFNTQQQPPANEGYVEYPQYRPYIESNEVIDNEGHVYVRKTEQPPAPQAPAAEPEQPSQSSAAGAEEEPRTILIFKDGRQMEVSNYAIMGSTLYLFSGDHRKISLADLDLPATERANDDRGIEFRVPNAS